MSILQTAQELTSYTLLAVDGEVGRMETLYFNAMTWKVCYLLVNTGSWLPGRQVLISPVAIGEVNEEERTIFIELSRKQIAGSPLISTGCPISRQDEVEYYQYYHWAPYWEVSPLSGVSKSGEALRQLTSLGTSVIGNIKEIDLLCVAQLKGYLLAVMEGGIGMVEELIIDTQYWLIRYLQVDTSDWREGYVLISTDWIETLCCSDRVLSLGLPREAIKHAPAFEPSMPISRAYETQLFKHYGRPVYWRKGNGAD